MPKLIKQVHDLVNLAIDKGVTDYIPNSDIDDAIDQGQMGLFRELLREHPKTKRSRNYLLPFEEKESITITTLVGSIGATFEHEIEGWVTVNSVNYPIKFIESGFYRRRVLDKVDPPSTTNLFATIYNDSGIKIEVSNQVSPIILRYFKRPVKPVYATIEVDSQIVYDDATSTDVEWSDLVHDIIMERTFKILGLNLREFQVMQAGQEMMPKEASL